MARPLTVWPMAVFCYAAGSTTSSLDNSGGWKEANGRMAELAAASELPERPGWPRLMVQPLAQPRPDVAA